LSILIYGEYRGGGFRHSVFEAVSAGRKLADEMGVDLSVLVIGESKDGIAEALGKYGADRVIYAESNVESGYNQEMHADIIRQAVEKYGFTTILFTATTTGKELAPRVAAKIDAGIAADCSGLGFEGGKLFAVRPIYAGKAYIKVAFNSDKAVISLRPKLFLAGEKPSTPAVEDFDYSPVEPKAKVTSIQQKKAGSIDLTEADIIVSGGRGVKGPEGFDPVKELADTLSGVVGASRAAVDAGWIDHSYQVGQTGKTVNPQLYIACGISGAIQHLAGMRNSKVIVAINKDADAPIFKIADYGIVGDLFQVIPALIEEIKKVSA